MAYLRPGQIRFNTFDCLDDGAGPAFAVGFGGQPFLIAGSRAIFLSGEWIGHGPPADNNYVGSIIDQVRFELDFESASTERISVRKLPLVRQGDELRMPCFAQQHAIGASVVTLAVGLPASSDQQPLYFPRWRVVVDNGDEVIVLFDNAQTDPADS